MADAPRTAPHPSAVLRPRPRLLARTVALVTRGARSLHAPAAAPAAVCPTAGEHRTYPAGRRGASGSTAAADRLRCADASPAGAVRRERAHEAVASHTTGPDDLASLLAMLDLRREQD